MAILTGKVGSIYAIDTTTAFSVKATTEDAATKIYQIDDTDMRIWDINTTIVLSAGVDFDKSYYDNGVNYFEGKVKLLTTGETTLTVTGSYLDLTEVAKAHGWGIDLGIETGECTSIGEAWKTFHPLSKSATANISRCRYDTKFDLAVNDTDIFLLKLYEDATAGYICNAIRTGLSQVKSVGAIDQESTTWQITSVVARF